MGTVYLVFVNNLETRVNSVHLSKTEADRKARIIKRRYFEETGDNMETSKFSVDVIPYTVRP